jgi:hypothetical protein
MGMRCLLICLPLCFIMASDGPPPSRSADAHPPPLGPLPKVADDGKALPPEQEMVRLARTAPLAFLEKCIVRYDREVKGYRCTLEKQERIKGELLPAEVSKNAFREQPFSVRMEWPKDPRPAYRTLYVKGENDNKLLVRRWNSRLVPIVTRDPEGADVRASTRYPPTEFGIQIGSRRTLAAWRAAHKKGQLRVTYEGEKALKELGNRTCWVLKRANFKVPEEDGIVETIMYFDKETWLQVGSVLKGEDGKLIGAYYFRDVKLNPKFAASTFTREGLKR